MRRMTTARGNGNGKPQGAGQVGGSGNPQGHGAGGADSPRAGDARDNDAAQPEGRPVSNFAFLKGEWPALYDEAARAERLAYADPRARKRAELYKQAEEDEARRK
jgi:hypothetical protein